MIATPTRTQIESAMLLAVADEMGVRCVRRWHTESYEASIVLKEACDRDNFGIGCGIIKNAVADFLEGKSEEA